MSTKQESRIDAARRGVQNARVAIAAAALALFGGLIGVVSHARAGSGSSGTDDTPASVEDQQPSFGFDFGDGSVAPSTDGGGLPSVQSGSS